MSAGGEGFTLYLNLKENDFDLVNAVCNHGFFMMAPNRWNPASKTLERPLRLADSTNSVTVSIFKPCIFDTENTLVLRIHNVNPNRISREDEYAVKQQVCRMLRISQKDEENVKEYHRKICSIKDNEDHFKASSGRIFRSPSLFEDLVKCLLLCNCKWSNSLKMARALCEVEFGPSTKPWMRSSGQKRQREETDATDKSDDTCRRVSGTFPSSKELARLDVETFKELTKNILGYRAKHILKLAKDVESGKIRLDELDKGLEDKDDLLQKFMQIKGFGSFASANALMCVGFYHRVPADTETIRHLKEEHGRENCNKNTVMKDAEEIYGKYAPFQCLAYWSELLDSYERKFGKLSELPSSAYHTISGRLESFESTVE